MGIADITAPLATVLNGVAAGIMFSTVVGIVPMFVALPYQGYVRSVQFLWRRYDPMMPILNMSALVLVVVSAVLGGPTARPAFISAAVLLATVVIISVTKNVPVNKYVFALDADHQPDDWAQADPRARWRRWNNIRTSLALAAFVVDVTGTALLH
jgi:uncharacterized membrane protein